MHGKGTLVLTKRHVQ